MPSKRFIGAQRRSKRLKGFKGFKEVQRPGEAEETYSEGVVHGGGPGRCCWFTTGNKKVNKFNRIVNWVLQRCNTFLFDALYTVYPRCIATQYLVCKKTNKFNDLTVKNRLTAVRPSLDVVANSRPRHKWKFGQSSAHPLSIDLIFPASLRCWVITTGRSFCSPLSYNSMT